MDNIFYYYSYDAFKFEYYNQNLKILDYNILSELFLKLKELFKINIT